MTRGTEGFAQGKPVKDRDRGSYSLLIRLRSPSEIQVGKRGRVHFPAGYYVYTGSAMNGLTTRISYHLRQGRKKPHWHIDYLLAASGSMVVGVIEHHSRLRQECQYNRRVALLPNAQVIRRKFGASDCRASCPSHLFYFGRRTPKAVRRDSFFQRVVSKSGGLGRPINGQTARKTRPTVKGNCWLK